MTGYSEANVERTVTIWAHGAAHGAWKETISRVEAGSEPSSCSHWVLVVTSVMVDMAEVQCDVQRFSPKVAIEW